MLFTIYFQAALRDVRSRALPCPVPDCGLPFELSCADDVDWLARSLGPRKAAAFIRNGSELELTSKCKLLLLSRVVVGARHATLVQVHLIYSVVGFSNIIGCSDRATKIPYQNHPFLVNFY